MEADASTNRPLSLLLLYSMYGAPTFVLHVCNEGWTGLANCLRDGVGIWSGRGPRHGESWTEPTAAEGEAGGQGERIVGVGVGREDGSFVLCYDRYSHIQSIRVQFDVYNSKFTLPLRQQKASYLILLDPTCMYTEGHGACMFIAYKKGLNKTPDPRLRVNPRRRSHLAGVSFRPFASP